ncbi:RICIN domain-containing protein [Sphingomonas sp. MMS12-HWE2-04]|uniref:RICIN domain-containing protein n=1 Tax=Sphingomonas sp. MMS12-HWE2-04 TaxID=3234199 RepID=UPI00384B5E10
MGRDVWNAGGDLWTLVEAGNGHFLLLAGDDLALEIPDGDDRPGAPVQVSKRTGGDNQLWFFARRPDPAAHTMLIVNKQSQLAIDVDGARGEPGAKVQQWPAAGNANQRWRFVSLAPRT